MSKATFSGSLSDGPAAGSCILNGEGSARWRATQTNSPVEVAGGELHLGSTVELADQGTASLSFSIDNANGATAVQLMEYNAGGDIGVIASAPIGGSGSGSATLTAAGHGVRFEAA